MIKGQLIEPVHIRVYIADDRQELVAQLPDRPIFLAVNHTETLRARTTTTVSISQHSQQQRRLIQSDTSKPSR